MNRWLTRQPTKHGRLDPPRTTANRIGEPSSAMRRQEQRIRDKQFLSDYIQLAPDVIVVWEQQPYRIVEVTERPVDLWDAKYEKKFQDALEQWDRYPRGERPEKTTWNGRPMAFVLQRDGKPKDKPLHLEGPASHTWDVLPEHYAVCAACGELVPCRHALAEQQADQEAARADVVMDIPPGHCLGCGEYVSPRQQAARFPGPNLWRPDLPEHSAVFHARQDCSSAVDRYQLQWEARGNQRRQDSLFEGEESA